MTQAHVNDLLRPDLHTFPKTRASETVVAKFFLDIASRLRDFLPIAPSATDQGIEKDAFAGKARYRLFPELWEEMRGRSERAAESKRHDEGLANLNRQIREDAKRKEKQSDEETFLLLLATEEYRKEALKLLCDIADARTVVSHAYRQALNDEEAAGMALESVRQNAIVLSDGRRVYFTKDGTVLYAEDDHEVSSQPDIAEARQKQLPGNSTYEELCARRSERDNALAHAESLRRSLETLDEIEGSAASGKLSLDELKHAREEVNRIVMDLPTEFRDEYTRLQAARRSGQEPSYRAADPSFASLPSVNADFFRAVHPPAVTSLVNAPETGELTDRLPAYKAAPDF